MSRPMRIFIDTSVIGGCFDDRFAADSRRVFELAESGLLTLVVSDVILGELAPAPERVRAYFDGVSRSCMEIRETDRHAADLRDAYLASGVLAPRWMDDAAHVAVATVARVDALVSWNFKHLVRLDRIKGFNQVNLAQGYGILTILSPTELREYET